MDLSARNLTTLFVHRFRSVTFIACIFVLGIHSPCMAHKMDLDCKIYTIGEKEDRYNNYEKKAISSFRKFIRKKITKFEICTVENNGNEIFFSIEKNVDKPPVPGSDFFVVINKKTMQVQILEGK